MVFNNKDKQTTNNAKANVKAPAKANKDVKAKAIADAKARSKEDAKTIKQNKKSNKDKGSKIVNELSEIAKRLNIRVSSPYGYYPDDVDPILARLEKDVSNLTKENKKLSEEVLDKQNKLTAVTQELSALKMQMSLMEVPDLSSEESFAMLGRIDSITGNYNSQTVQELKDINQPVQPKQSIKLKLRNK